MTSESQFEDKVKELEEWIKNNQTLPELIDNAVVRRYLYCTGESMEKTKKLIEFSYSMRTKYPHLFFDRDPLDFKVQNIHNIVDLGIPMPSLTACQRRIVINRLIDHDPDNFDFDTIIKAFFIAADYRFSMYHEDLPYKINSGDIPVFDMTGLSYRHLTKVTLSTLRCYMKFTQEGFPVKIREIHLINVSPVLSKLLTLLKPFMKERVRKMLHYHSPNTSTLFDHIEQELFPNDYGGMAGEMRDIKQKFIKQMEGKREYLSNGKYWKPRDVNNNFIEDANIKFTELNID